MWGLHKNNNHQITYQKLTRPIRYYHGRGIIDKPGDNFIGSRDHVYKFTLDLLRLVGFSCEDIVNRNSQFNEMKSRQQANTIGVSNANGSRSVNSRNDGFIESVLKCFVKDWILRTT